MHSIAFALLLHPYSVAATMHASISELDSQQLQIVKQVAPWLAMEFPLRAQDRSRLATIARRMEVGRRPAAPVLVRHWGGIGVFRKVAREEITTSRGGRSRRSSGTFVTGDGSSIETRGGFVGTSVRRGVNLQIESAPVAGRTYHLAAANRDAKKLFAQIVAHRVYDKARLARIMDEQARSIEGSYESYRRREWQLADERARERRELAEAARVANEHPTRGMPAAEHVDEAPPIAEKQAGRERDRGIGPAFAAALAASFVVVMAFLFFYFWGMQ